LRLSSFQEASPSDSLLFTNFQVTPKIYRYRLPLFPLLFQLYKCKAILDLIAFRLRFLPASEFSKLQALTSSIRPTPVCLTQNCLLRDCVAPSLHFFCFCPILHSSPEGRFYLHTSRIGPMLPLFPFLSFFWPDPLNQSP